MQKHGPSSPRTRPPDPGFGPRQPPDAGQPSTDGGRQPLPELPELAEQGRSRSSELSPRGEGPLRSALSKLPSMVGHALHEPGSALHALHVLDPDSSAGRLGCAAVAQDLRA